MILQVHVRLWRASAVCCGLFASAETLNHRHMSVILTTAFHLGVDVAQNQLKVSIFPAQYLEQIDFYHTFICNEYMLSRTVVRRRYGAI